MSEKTKIALALGGGAVLGAAHIGALRAIEERNLEVAFIAGTSIGALVASLYAFGKNPQNVEDIAMDMKWSQITSFSPSKFGLFSNKKIQDLLNDNIGEATFDQANIPLSVLASNISNGKKVIITEGNVGQAVMASTCIPGLFKPVELNGELLVDGGMTENVPISPLRSQTDLPILAIDLNAVSQYKTPTNIMGILLNSFHFTLAAVDKAQHDKPDLMVAPDLSKFNWYSSKQTPELIEIGYQETLNRLETMGW